MLNSIEQPMMRQLLSLPRNDSQGVLEADKPDYVALQIASDLHAR
jgi:hypothetical protein